VRLSHLNKDYLLTYLELRKIQSVVRTPRKAVSTNRSPISIKQFYKQTVQLLSEKIIITNITHKCRWSSFEARNTKSQHNTVWKLIPSVYNTTVERISISNIYDIMLQQFVIIRYYSANVISFVFKPLQTHFSFFHSENSSKQKLMVCTLTTKFNCCHCGEAASGPTDVRTAEKSGSQTDVTMPVGRVYTHVAGDERRLEKLLTLLLAVFVTRKLLQHVATVTIGNQQLTG